MWTDSREALSTLKLDDRDCILDVGCGTGELSKVLADESGGEVVGLDRDHTLLTRLPDGVTGIRGDARSLPFTDDAVDLVVCQALLVNLTDPEAAVGEFARVAHGRVAAIEPDNAAVTVESTVNKEPQIAKHARERYLDGLRTEAALGADARTAFQAAGIEGITTHRYDHELVVAPPYDPDDVSAIRRKASAARLREHRETMTGNAEELDLLRERWRAMGREVIRQAQAGEYRRREIVPFYVTVGEA